MAPASLSGNDAGEILTATNTGAGGAIRGASVGGEAVRGEHTPSGNYGYLGGADHGVYGSAAGPDDWAGWFDGRAYFSDAVIIGTNTPAQELEVWGEQAGIRLYSTNATTGSLIKVRNLTPDATRYAVYSVHDDTEQVRWQMSNTNWGTFFSVWDDVGAQGAYMKLHENGNIGIGDFIGAPPEKLTVAGTVESTTVASSCRTARSLTRRRTSAAAEARSGTSPAATSTTTPATSASARTCRRAHWTSLATFA